MHETGHDYAITYVGGMEILTHPLYVKWSQLNLTAIKAGIVTVKQDLGNIEANMDNLAIISYLSTLVRIGGLI
jgi:hypothetical protein